MTHFKRLRTIAVIVAGLAAVVLATPASAQATRTWVSGVGDDVNPCSRTAPCKTFAGAISKTAAGGEINCLDPGGFGAVTIIKSMTISCPYTEGGALAGGNGITVNLPAVTDVVVIRGLDIFGVNPPSNGIRFIGQGSLHVMDTVIRRFNAANSFGISFQPSTGASRLFLNNVTVADNGGAASGGGVLIQPSGTGSAQVVLENTRIIDNVNIGFRVIVSAGTGAAGVTGLLDEVTVARTNGGDGIQAVAAAGAPPARLMIVNSNVVANSSRGITADGSSATMRVARSNITTNGTGVQAVNSAVINTYGNNRNDGNTSDGAFTLPAILEE